MSTRTFTYPDGEIHLAQSSTGHPPGDDRTGRLGTNSSTYWWRSRRIRGSVDKPYTILTTWMPLPCCWADAITYAECARSCFEFGLAMVQEDVARIGIDFIKKIDISGTNQSCTS